MPLFGGNDRAKINEDMQNLSDQIGALSRQVADRNTQIAQLQQQLEQAQTTSTADTQDIKDAQAQSNAFMTQLQASQSQVTDLSRQLAELRTQLSQENTTHTEATEAKDALQQQVSALQQQLAQTPATAAMPQAGSMQPTAPMPNAIAIGGQAWVTQAGGLPLRLRSGPGLSNHVLDRLEPGTQMTLVNGPQQADGHGWWNIRTSDGRSGWVAGEDLRPQPD